MKIRYNEIQEKHDGILKTVSGSIPLVGMTVAVSVEVSRALAK